ncbi:MAG: GTP-binding protein [Syntrophobacterales bacterium]|jgi:G3E family GTPase
MKLGNLHPTDILSSPQTTIQELMRDLLVRTNFVPGVRHVIGWRGLKDSSLEVEGWTAKIKGSSGVFGLYFDEPEEIDEWVIGRFRLNYFPDPDEELVELFSLQAGFYTQEDNYLGNVRNFLSHPQISELFNIAEIHLAVKKTEDALILGLESISRQRVIAKDGIFLSQDGDTVELVAPGCYEQDLPSYKTAIPFYHVLAASFTFNLEEPPVYLNHLSKPGNEVIYDSTGNYWKIPSQDAQREYLYLGYGRADFDGYMKQRTNKEKSPEKTLVWEKGDEIPVDYEDALWWDAYKISDYKTLDKQILGIDDRPQLIVLTGFLGSGKTSFLQHFIEYQLQFNRFVAIIQNEIGEVGLDGRLLDHDYSVMEIDEGCVCCSLVGSLKNAIHQILSSFHPDYIVLETTGLANPYNLLEEMAEVEDLVRFDSVTTIVDAKNVERSLAECEVVAEQIRAANLLLLNKKDLLNELQLQEVKNKLRQINPTAPILTTQQGDINPAVIYTVDPQDSKEITDQKAYQGEEVQIHHTHEEYALSSYKISFSESLDKDRFLETMKFLPLNVFRIKGVLDFIDTDKPVLFQYVGGRFELSEFNNPNLTDRFLIFVGQDLQKESIESAFSHLMPSNRCTIPSVLRRDLETT